MEMSLVLRLIIAVVLIFIISTFYLEAAQLGKPPELPKVIYIVNSPDKTSISIDSPVGTENPDWPMIEIEIKAEYSAALKPEDKLNVLSVITFKEVDKKAKIVNKDGSEVETFILTKENPKFSGKIRVRGITTKESPIRCGKINQDNELNEGDIIFIAEGMESGGIKNEINFTLKLLDLGTFKGGSLSEKWRNRDVCGGTFELECYDRFYTFDLLDESKCAQTGLMEPCQKVISLCNTTVTLTAGTIECRQPRMARVTFEVEGGRKYKTFPGGERVGLTFFKNTECVKNLNSIKDMKFECSTDFLGGTYYFTGGLVGSSANGCK